MSHNPNESSSQTVGAPSTAAGHLAPLAEALKLIDPEQIRAFLLMLFQLVEAGIGAVMLRGVGEKGTPQEGKFHWNLSLPLGASIEELMPRVLEAAQRWGQYLIGTFIVPALMDLSILDDNKGTDDRVKLFTAVCVDIDKGDTDAALAHLSQRFGRPTMIVHSGGTTETGKPKLHLWWALKEPTSEVAKVADLRERMALLVGGDPSFKRVGQVIRVPGTVYAKNSVPKRCQILGDTNRQELPR
jgi:hypothetical protein